MFEICNELGIMYLILFVDLLVLIYDCVFWELWFVELVVECFYVELMVLIGV